MNGKDAEKQTSGGNMGNHRTKGKQQTGERLNKEERKQKRKSGGSEEQPSNKKLNGISIMITSLFQMHASSAAEKGKPSLLSNVIGC